MSLQDDVQDLEESFQDFVDSFRVLKASVKGLDDRLVESVEHARRYCLEYSLYLGGKFDELSAELKQLQDDLSRQQEMEAQLQAKQEAAVRYMKETHKILLSFLERNPEEYSELKKSLQSIIEEVAATHK